MWDTAISKYVIGAVCRSLPVTCFCLALLVVPPHTSAGDGSVNKSMNTRRNNAIGLSQNNAPVPTSRDQQRPPATSLQRRDCLPVPHDSLWVRLNVAEPPPLVPVDVRSSAKRVGLTAFVDRRPRFPPRMRRDVQPPSGGGRRRSRTKPITGSASLSSTSPTRLETVTSDNREVRRRRTTPTSAPSETPPVTESPSISAANRRLTSSKSRSIDSTSAGTLQPETKYTTTQLPVDGRDSGSNDDVMAAAFRQTSWQCRSEPYWRRMPTGTFPPYIQTARCRQTKCMLGMYECVARRYGVKVLRRVDGRCLPVPLIAAVHPNSGNTTARLDGGGIRLDADGGTTYEQAWIFVETQVVVGCDCTKRRITSDNYGFSSASSAP